MVEHCCGRVIGVYLWVEECGGDFQCWICQQTFGWCMGSADELDREVTDQLDGDGVCNECWLEWTRLRESIVDTGLGEAIAARSEEPCGSGPYDAARTACTD